MLRSTVSKVMWVGRATVFSVGLAVILALLVWVTSMALGVNDKLITNTTGPALDLRVDSGPPLELSAERRRHRVRCAAGQRLIGGLCYDVNPQTAATLVSASDNCSDLGGRLPAALQLRSIRDEPGIDLGSTTPHWSSDLQHLGTANPPNDLAAVAVFDSGGMLLRDDQEQLPYRCVYQR